MIDIYKAQLTYLKPSIEGWTQTADTILSIHVSDS